MAYYALWMVFLSSEVCQFLAGHVPATSRKKLTVDRQNRVYMIFRDAERGDGVSIAICDDPQRENWRFVDLPINNQIG